MIDDLVLPLGLLSFKIDDCSSRRSKRERLDLTCRIELSSSLSPPDFL